MIAVHGGGYIGIVGAAAHVVVGREVVVYDPDPVVIAAIKNGDVKSTERLPHLTSLVHTASKSGRLHATTDFDVTLGCDVHIVAVPSERDGKPDMSIVDACLLRIAETCRPHAVVIVESTMTPGTTQRLRPMIEGLGRTFGENGRPGQPLYWAVAPRRDWLGGADKMQGVIARVIGGVTSRCTEKALEVLAPVSGPIYTTTAETAEFVKALENSLLHVMVVHAHQLAMAFPSCDIAEAVRLAGTHWRLPQLFLNLGVGGRCVPIGTRYLVEAATDAGREELSIAIKTLQTDEALPTVICCNAIMRQTRVGAHIAVLGVGYRPGFRDRGESAGVKLAYALAEQNYFVRLNDPLYTDEELGQILAGSLPFRVDDWGWADVIVLATPHQEYLDLPAQVSWKPGQLVFDAQGAWRAQREIIEQAGARYVQVGGPKWRG